MKSIFVTGTDTNIGKTVVSAILCKKLNIPYWKPIQSGVIDGDMDAHFVESVSGVKTYTSITLQQPLSPHLASKIDGVKIRLQDIASPFTEPHICEGAGGVLVPINEKDLMIDLMKHLGYQVVIVARSGLGTINHTCLTIQALKAKNIEILGVVLVGDFNADNKASIEEFSGVPVIGEIPIMDTLKSQIITMGQYIKI